MSWVYSAAEVWSGEERGYGLWAAVKFFEAHNGAAAHSAATAPSMPAAPIAPQTPKFTFREIAEWLSLHRDRLSFQP